MLCNASARLASCVTLLCQVRAITCCYSGIALGNGAYGQKSSMTSVVSVHVVHVAPGLSLDVTLMYMQGCLEMRSLAWGNSRLVLVLALVQRRGRQPNIEEVNWPPSVEQWVHFLLSVRPKVSSYKRFLNLVGNVAHTASRHWEKKTGTPSTKLQPSVLYPSAHKQAIATVRRQYGMGMKQVKAITMIEARNGTHYTD